MRLVPRLLVASLLLALSAPMAAQSPPAAQDEVGIAPQMTFERSSLQADVDIVERTYTALHPGLYRYNTPAQMRAHFADLRKALDGSRTLAQAYLAFSEFAATVQCGHTWANFSNQSKDVQRGLFERGRVRVPAEFLWRDGRMLVTRDLTGKGVLPPGTVISAIDGIDTKDVLARLMRIARADGGNDAKRRDQLQVQGLEKWEPFDVYLPLYFPQLGERMTLRTTTPAGASKDVVVQGLDYAQRLAARHVEADDPHAGWRLDTSDPRIAVMKMPTWALYDTKWDWKGWIEDAFVQLDKSPRAALVVDLRGNEGGLDAGDALLPHLVDAPMKLSEPVRLVRYRKVAKPLLPYLETWDPSFKDWGDDAQPYAKEIDGQRYFTLRDDDAPPIAPGTEVIERTLAPKAPRYRGRVFVLIDASNSSATFQFAERVRAAKLATLVGEPTGGNQRGINGGAFFFLQLTNTGLEVDVPLIARFPMRDGKAPPDAGLTPDIAASPKPGDIAAGTDVAMAAVRAALDK
ncbi:hypothetical protein LYSHEL_24890 [Lysobacter helvus]|uniref:Tail specific protease domain-containing protein n=2 Tax=Lysobacteraceae TaxID=32033 RepID=A0ABM7Q7R6_9GAMM|nr:MULTISPECIES: S41 family peptidase [Lysobacter]BCT93465.1 hypothetical protein LYSCAS_24890 [Lysobacter caseinilyticus]BCT96618.1 hypothetical protein LYSHEL_24890 [Lysobacter helvus]